MPSPLQLLQNFGGTDLIDMVDIGTIEVTEVAPPGVGSMRFTVTDPTKAVTIGELDVFRLVVVSSGLPLFRGFATNVTYRPSGLGRTIEVDCTGVECLLDWYVAPAITILAATNFPNGVQQIVTAKTSIFDTSIDGTRGGDATDPIGSFIHPTHGVPALSGGVNYTVPAGTLRQQIEQYQEMCGYGGTTASFGALVTVDAGLRLRAFEDDLAVQPLDWQPSLTVLDTVGGSVPVAANLEATFDYGAKIHNVYVIGTGVTGYVGSAASSARHEAIVNDSDINTASERDIAGGNYLISHLSTERGSFRIESFSPSGTEHAGGLLTLTDANVGLTGSPQYRISEIVKRFLGNGTQNWEVSYGRPAPSAMRQLRSLTRGTF